MTHDIEDDALVQALADCNELKRINADLLAACKALLQAMVDYEMMVNDEYTSPPHRHRKMMEVARAAIAKAEGRLDKSHERYGRIEELEG